MDEQEEKLREFIEEHGGYWDGEVQERSVADWRQAVCNGSTRAGYWDWAYAEAVAARTAALYRSSI